MPARSRPPPRLAALAAAAVGVALLCPVVLMAAPAAASSSRHHRRAAAAFLGPKVHPPRARQPLLAGGSSSSSSSHNNHENQKVQQRRLVVEDDSFDALIARAHEAALRQERASPPPLAPPRPPTPAEEREVLLELTGLLYHALNERSTDTMARLWLEDDPSVLFFAGDGAGPVKGYAAVVDMLRTVRQEERRLDPGRSKGPLMLHPTVEASDFRVVVNGMHAWVTCKETMARGLTKEHPFDPKEDHWVGTNLFRRFNGQWRLVMHWSGRLAPVHEQLQEMLQEKKQKELAKQQGGGGGGGGGRAGGSKGMQRLPFRPEDLGLPPGMSLDGAEAEITWELDEEDLADFEFEEGDEGEWEFDPATGGFTFSSASPGVIIENPMAQGMGGGENGDGGGGLLDSWHRTAVFRQKTKKALGAVRKLAREGRITKVEKARLIHSVIASTSHDEISQVEMAYDLLVKRGVGDLEEFADQCKAISAEYGAGYQ